MGIGVAYAQQYNSVSSQLPVHSIMLSEMNCRWMASRFWRPGWVATIRNSDWSLGFVARFKISQTDSDWTDHQQEIREAREMARGAFDQLQGKAERWLVLILTLLAFIVLIAFAALPVPGVNETHYLTKAKHFWNPEWCKGDLFLKSSNAHLVFFAAFGWLSSLMSLEAFAWTGRVLCWLAMAFALVRLCGVLNIDGLMSIVAITLFMLLSNRFGLAGEWVVGGFEAKSVAYMFVVISLQMFLTGRWHWFWILLGLATLFHAVIGIWAAVCFLGAKAIELFDPQRRRDFALTQLLRSQYWSIALFVVMVFVAAISPILSNIGTDTATISAANRIQVHQRLAHHLVFGHFPTSHVARFGLLLLFWFLVNRMMTLQSRQRLLARFCNASLAISFCGLLLSAATESAGWIEKPANFLLRFYWFRFSDFAIPFGLAMLAGSAATSLFNSGARGKKNAVWFASVSIMIAALVHSIEIRLESRPGADRASLPSYAGDLERTQQTWQNWVKACRWIAANVEEGSIFFTPIDQQSFKWYAGRAEVACWKDAPQDAEGIVRWHDRMTQLRAIEYRISGGLLGLTEQQLSEFASRTGATHMIIPQAILDAVRDSELPLAKRTDILQIYPQDKEERTTYVVFRLVASPKPTREADTQPDSKSGSR